MSQQQKSPQSEIFSEKLKELRGRRSQKDFAIELGIGSQQTYGNYERGRIPKPHILEQIAKRTGRTMEWFLEGPKISEAEGNYQFAPKLEMNLALSNILGGGPAINAKEMRDEELIRKINEHSTKLLACPEYEIGPQSEIISAFALELYKRTKQNSPDLKP